MKIVQAIGWYLPESLGGTEVYVEALCRAFTRAGHTVLVAAPDPGADGERTYSHDGTTVYRYPIPQQPTRAEVQGSIAVRGAARFHRWLAAERPDVVHLHTFVTGMGLAELRAAKACGARTIVTTHSSSLGFLCMRGTLMQWGEVPCDGVSTPAKCAACALDARGVPRALANAVSRVPVDLARLAGRLRGPIGTAIGMSAIVRDNMARERELLALADRFVVLTEGARQILRANGLGNGNIVVNRVGVGVPVEARSARPRRDPGRAVSVGYLGRFDVIKGVEVLARAAALLEPDVPITIEFRGPVQSAGERAVRANLEAIAGGDRRVRFADAVPHDRTSDVLRGYDVLCCPSICFEGGPLVALEAQAVGTPVVGSRMGGLAEIVEEDVNGRLLPPNDPYALARALREIACHPETTVDRWHAHDAPPRTMAQVVSDYLTLYHAC